ncbi:CBN-SPAT-1 protein [Caenorhabditis brenneri]|uniref:Protein aurora borealis n=1 Tax=Caenorhabditis brenneri TaxID=135651 RepID=G0NZW7_CAEBE|nr:CBN-SPAT-1 protein [Caenorhabditis brenneri]
MNLDLKKILGDCFVYQSEQDFDDEEVFNVSVSSNFSTRRRLFSTSGEREEDGDDVANSSILSTDDLMLNESSSQAFNDSLSPVRRSEDVTEDAEESGENMDQENSSTTSGATRSHASQIAINISILNDCMMNSIDEAEEDENEDKQEDNDDDIRRRVFSDSHIHANEYEILDRSSSSNATPRHEDLDWTPRRFTGPLSNSVTRGGGSSGAASSGTFGSGGSAPQELRRFVFDMSPIHPNHNLPTAMRTPIQRCHLNLPQGRLNLNDEEEDGDDGLGEREK